MTLRPRLYRRQRPRRGGPLAHGDGPQCHRQDVLRPRHRWALAARGGAGIFTTVKGYSVPYHNSDMIYCGERLLSDHLRLRRSSARPAKMAKKQRRWASARARSHSRFAPPLIHCTPDSRTHSVPLFIKQQCDRTIDALYHRSSTSYQIR